MLNPRKERVMENKRITEVKELLSRFTHSEPYITNTAIRIARIFDPKNEYEPIDPKKLEPEAYLRGYNNGYRAGRRGAKPKPHNTKGIE
ncbi:hypothetical protein ACFZAD_24430 [Streptomyces iakyrus]|uniref:hypothetical protein n=1 Tax=Streptomyces iakyrus TaxID=68219 RepID=UPI0036E9E16B